MSWSRSVSRDIPTACLLSYLHVYIWGALFQNSISFPFQKMRASSRMLSSPLQLTDMIPKWSPVFAHWFRNSYAALTQRLQTIWLTVQSDLPSFKVKFIHQYVVFKRFIFVPLWHWRNLLSWVCYYLSGWPRTSQNYTCVLSCHIILLWPSRRAGKLYKWTSCFMYRQI